MDDEITSDEFLAFLLDQARIRESNNATRTKATLKKDKPEVFRVWRESSARRLSAVHDTPRAGEMALCAEAPSQHCLLAEGTSQRGFSKEESGTGVECAA
ncbi:hypothetical protein T05_3719 [Trichinella murrelli]|uniref:Uncharacterized protein n=1 Tax=Trichinella murrelli TaxID=144512 RepID=A0A0V0T563_9BILA|nr:hypothetical protein T05_3719 [Trichinella murrelli]